MLSAVGPIVLLLATLCMQWVELVSFGEFSIKVPYVALALIIALTLFSGKKINATLQVIRGNAYWIVPFALYVVIMGVVQAGTPAATSAPRQAFFLIGAIALAGSLASTRQLSRTLRIGALLGLGLLIALIEVLAQRIGLSWWDAVDRFIEGDFKFVFYSFFREIFNSIRSADDEMGASTKNAVAVGVLILGLLYRSATKKTAWDISGVAFMVLVLGLLFLLNTRSALIAAGLSFILALIVGTAARPDSSLPALFLKAAAAATLIILAVGTSLPTDAVSGQLGERFTFDDRSTASRLEQYRAAFDQIQLHPFAGGGYFEFGGHVPHNLFLSAWAQGGLVAFLLVLFFYGGLLVGWLSFLRLVMTRPRAWVLPLAPEWLAPLPIVPLFRMWSSGDGGHMYLGEWVAVSCFFGCCLANQLRSRAMARYIERQQGMIYPMSRASLAQPAGR